MKNTLQTIISIARANPEYARIAITLDACIGLAFGLFAYLILNAVDVAPTSFVVLVIGTLMFVAGITVLGVTTMSKATTEDSNEYQDIEFPED